MVRLRLATGRRHHADKGEYAYGGPPFRYRAERGQLLPRPEEQDALALIAELRRDPLKPSRPTTWSTSTTCVDPRSPRECRSIKRSFAGRPGLGRRNGETRPCGRLATRVRNQRPIHQRKDQFRYDSAGMGHLLGYGPVSRADQEPALLETASFAASP